MNNHNGNDNIFVSFLETIPKGGIELERFSTLFRDHVRGWYYRILKTNMYDPLITIEERANESLAYIRSLFYDRNPLLTSLIDSKKEIGDFYLEVYLKAWKALRNQAIVMIQERMKEDPLATKEALKTTLENIDESYQRLFSSYEKIRQTVNDWWKSLGLAVPDELSAKLSVFATSQELASQQAMEDIIADLVYQDSNVISFLQSVNSTLEAVTMTSLYAVPLILAIRYYQENVAEG